MGSIVAPSAQNNLVGIKPTLGLTSREFVIPITRRQDTVGPLARTVRDAAIVLNAIAGKDLQDNYTLLQPFDTPPDYTKALNLSAMRGARIGVPRNGIVPWSSIDYYQMLAFERSINILRDAGAHVVDPADFPAFGKSMWDEWESKVRHNNSKIFETDFVAGVEDYLSKVSTPENTIHDLWDIMNCTKNNPQAGYPDHDIKVWTAAAKLNFTNESKTVWDAYQADLYMGGPGGVVGALDRYDLDALVLPTMSSMLLPGLAGLPIVTVPMGKQPQNATCVFDGRGEKILLGPNIPFGLAFMGRAWSEETLISLAYAFEQRTMERMNVKPWIQPKTELKSRSTRK